MGVDSFNDPTILWRIYRRSGWQMLEGFVIYYSAAWVGLHVVGRTIDLDGYTFVRSTDIESIERVLDDSFLSIALRLRRQSATPVLAKLDAAYGDREFLLALADVYPLVAIYDENSRAGTCIIGNIVNTTDANMAIKTLDDDARWDEVELMSYDNVTRLDCGDRYIEALWAVAQWRRASREA